jgi:anti-sigma factor NepR-like protein
MMRDQGKRLARVYPEEVLQEKIAPEPAIDRAIQARIGEKLRAMYDELLEQPVPDRFKSLVDRLGESEE